jgi:hypothetical protein
MKGTLHLLVASLVGWFPTAHVDSALTSWLENWSERFEVQFDTGTVNVMRLAALWEEFDDVRDRHPCRRVIDTWHDGCRVPTRHHHSVPVGVEHWRSLVATYFPAHEVDRALCIMWHESKGDPNAKNPTSSASGLFQHLARYWPERSSAAGWASTSIFDPIANIAVAAWLVSQDGWRHWSPYQRGLCR